MDIFFSVKKKQHYVRSFLLFFIFFLVTACSTLDVPLTSSERAELTNKGEEQETKPSKLEEVRMLLAQGNYTRAERLAFQISSSPLFGAEERKEAWSIYAIAAERNSHPYSSLAALDEWRKLDPQASSTLLWQTVWTSSLAKLEPREARRNAEAILSDTKESVALHNAALLFLIVQDLSSRADAQALDLLEKAYTESSRQEKALMEHMLLKNFSQAAQSALMHAEESISEENKLRFPYNCILVAKGKKLIQSAGTKAEGESLLLELQESATFADKSIIEKTYIADTTNKQRFVDRVPGEIVLVLPLSGPYGTISSQILVGANLAVEELIAQGKPVSLVLVDTEKKGWLEDFSALSSTAHIVGGPLRSLDYQALKKHNLLLRQKSFSFLPTLDEGDEGRIAWRFFASPADQTRALVNFSNRIGVNKYAMLYPEESYGRHMATLFRNFVKGFGGTIAVDASYNPSAPGTWLSSVGRAFRSASEEASLKHYEAIFLPDSWKNMELLVPALQQYGNVKQVLLGSALWEQGILSSQALQNRQYQLAVFPGSWNPVFNEMQEKLQNGLNSRQQGKAGFWYGLGYDFVRFASLLDAQASAQDFNVELQQTQMHWSLAPIFWDTNGLAAQSMFLFTFTEEGFIPLEEGAFVNFLEKVRNE